MVPAGGIVPRVFHRVRVRNCGEAPERINQGCSSFRSAASPTLALASLQLAAAAIAMMLCRGFSSDLRSGPLHPDTSRYMRIRCLSLEFSTELLEGTAYRRRHCWLRTRGSGVRISPSARLPLPLYIFHGLLREVVLGSVN
jgi:hypothetical protein